MCLKRIFKRVDILAYIEPVTDLKEREMYCAAAENIEAKIILELEREANAYVQATQRHEDLEFILNFLRH